MKILIFLFSIFIGSLAWAQEELAPDPEPAASGAITSDSPGEPTAEGMRDPASEGVPGRKASDDELRVRSQLPDAVVKKDTRSMQGEVYKSIYNRDLKPDQREDVLDE